MKTAHAPSELPFVPKPYNNELFSSWMLRIAHANCVSLQELVLGFQCRHQDLSIPDPLDWGFSPAYLKAMARFSRTPVSKLHLLDLRTRLQQAEHALLLSFRDISHQRERLRSRRVGYAFCPTCIAHQPRVYVRWEWAFPALLRCHTHKSLLIHGCAACGEDDPLPFGAIPSAAVVQCRSCGARLASTIRDSSIWPIDDTHIIIQHAYRAALRGASPDDALLGDVTGAQFLHFVDDMFQLLAWYPSNELSPRSTDPRNLHFAFRKEILVNIGALVVNATVGSDAASRRVKVREGLKLWRRVLALLSHREASWIENAMECWPPALRRRLNAALDQHERVHSRFSPFRSRYFRPGLKYMNCLNFRDLSAVNDVKKQISGI
ncbi:MAG TPA: TniQ family protein [Candidatus Sulfotelmatobacter sp.]